MAKKSQESIWRKSLSVMLAALLATTPGLALAEGQRTPLADGTPSDAAVEAVELDSPEAAASESPTTVSDGENAETLPLDGDEQAVPADPAVTDATEANGPTDEAATDEAPAEQEEPAVTTEDVTQQVEEAPEEPGEETVEPAADPVVPATPASAQALAAGTYVLQATLAQEKVVVAKDASPSAGTKAVLGSYEDANNQEWVLERYKDTNWFVLRSAANKTLVLGVSGSSVVLVSADEADLPTTLWAFVGNSDGSLRLVNASKSTLALTLTGSGTANGTGLSLSASKGTAAQRFLMINLQPQVAAGKTGLEGAYVATDKASGLAVGIKGAKKTNSANAQVETKKGTDSQKIYLEPVDGGGFYIAWVVGSSKVLSISSKAVLSGSNVYQYKYLGKDGQKWALVASGNGYQLVNKKTGLRLMAEGTASGANLCVSYKGSTWQLGRTALLEAGIVEIKPESESGVSLGVVGASTKSDAGLELQKDNNALSQRFELVAAGATDVWRVRTGSSGGYLAVRSGKLVQYGKGATKVSADNTWRVTFRGGWYGLMLNDGSNRAITLSGGKTAAGTTIGIEAASGKDAQHFSFTDASLIQSGTYFIKNARGKLLFVKDCSSSSGANVQTYQKKSNRLLGEYFNIEKSGDYVRIRNTYSGLYVAARGKKAGSNIAMRTSSKSNAQKWQPIIADGGCIAFRGVGRYRKCAISVKNGSRRNNANVIMGKVNGGKAQRWKLVKTSYKLEAYINRAIRAANASSSATGYTIVVDRAKTRVVILTGGNGRWHLYRTYPCSCGKSSTPTVSGHYTIGSRGYSFTDDDHTCYYWTQITGDYLFHSVLYHAGTKRILDGRIGYHISMGCVRMGIGHAKWIHDNIPSGTRVIIY